MLTHYDVLSIEPTADFETIRHAWRVKVRLLHPDRHRGSPDEVQAEAARETLRINNAWDTLRDPEKRFRYDVHLLHLGEVEVAPAREADDERPDWPQEERRASLEWLSPLASFDLSSILVLLVALWFVAIGAVLLARMTQ